jgi:hypothetical protein
MVSLQKIKKTEEGLREEKDSRFRLQTAQSKTI